MSGLVLDEAARSEAVAEAGVVWFSCPHCGGPTAMADEDVSRPCGHCGSLLVLAREHAIEIGTVDCIVRDAERLVEVLVERRLAERRAEICDRESARDRDGHRVPPPMLEQRLAAEAPRIRERIAVGRSRLLWVPYLHVHGAAWQACFGRRRGGAKRIELRSFAGEATAGAHHADGPDGAERFNFRDRGLRLSVTRMRLLTRGDVAAGFRGLPARTDEETFEAAEDAARDRAGRPGIVPGVEQELVRCAGFVPRARALLYKPYWAAELRDGSRIEHLLVDAQTGIIAGDLVPGELDAMLAAEGEDPLAGRRAVEARLLGSRCVECGIDLPHEPRAHVRTCSQCHVAMSVSEDGLARFSYRWVEPPSSWRRPAWMPLWRHRFRLHAPASIGADEVTIDSLDALDRELCNGRLPTGLAGDALWVPGLRMLGTAPGERCFDALAEWLHRHPLETLAGPLPPRGQDRIVSASVSAEEAARLAHASLAAGHDDRSAARMNTPSARRWLADAEVEVTGTDMVLVPAIEDRAGWRLVADDGPVIPSLLVDAGPTLDQQRRALP